MSIRSATSESDARMTSRLINFKHPHGVLRPVQLGMALALVIAAGGDAFARSGRTEIPIEAVQSRAAGEPIVAVVSLHDQRVTVYDANGWILRAPVSSGQKGRETPAGIFSVIQKEVEHYSNLYDDAFMPHMQRITWSGIALHGGPLPGYAASHGCIRLPYDFAARLYELTRVGMRVIVAPTDVAPIEIAHPALFVPKPDIAAKAAERKVQADEAAGKASQARLAAVAASREAARATMALRAAETLKTRAEAQLAAAQAALASTKSPDKEELAKDAVAKATARLEELETKLNAAKAELQPKLDAVGPLREAAASAAAASAAAAQEARELSRALEPVSVFISRKTQRLYVRRAFAPILEIPVTIQDPERPIGTHVFTAVEQANSGMRWSVISVNDAGDAKSALDRIAFPQDASFDRIAGTAQLRSSVIISDEELSSETGKGTDFVVLLGGEPQGGIARRRSYAPAEAWYQGPRYRYRLPFWR
jgi:L,D-transpeptidase catalytic domain